MAQMNISNTLFNDTSTGEIAYVEQLKDRLLRTYIANNPNYSATDKGRIPADLKAEAGVFQEKLNEFFLDHWVDFQRFLLDEGVDPTVIDSWKEVQEFLEGLPDDETMWLKNKLTALDTAIAGIDQDGIGTFDVSAYNNTGGVYAQYADLAAALAGIPVASRRSGMAIRFINSETQQYEMWEYRKEYVNTTAGNTAFTTVDNWYGLQDTDAEPTAGSVKPVQSGGVWNAIKSNVTDTANADFEISDPNGNVLIRALGGHIKTKNFDSSLDATTEHRGIMSAADKKALDETTEKLESIEEGAEVNDVETKGTKKADLEFSDEDGNVLMQLSNGHIKTKYFDSSVEMACCSTTEFPVFLGKGLDDDGATVIDSDTTLLTPLIRVNSGDVVHISDVSKIDSIKVYEYSSENSTSFVASSNGFITDDYTIQSPYGTFIRIVGKPKTTDPLFIDSVIYGNSAFVNNVCVIHKKEIKDKKYYLASYIPSGWYVSNSSDFSTTPENEDPWENTGSALTLKQIYDKLQELAASYPEYFHLTQIGYDSADGKTPPSNYGNQFDDWLDGEGKVHIPVYKYELVSRPVEVEKGRSRGNNNSTIPTIYMDFGLHASEQPCMRAMLNMFIHLCRDWKDNAFLSYIRWNCRIVGIPMVCPYSYIDKNSSPTRNGRCNSNGVNINRNFYCNGLWNSVAPDTGGNNDKGSSPLSEIETKYVSRLILENADAIAAFSWHTHGVFTSYNNITRIETGAIRISDLLNSVGIEILRGLTVSGFQNHKLPYPLTDGSNYVGQVTRSGVNSVSNLSRDIVLPTSCPECMYRYYDGQSGAIYNTYLDCMNEEFVTNMILCALKQYFNNK